jgi:uncharacterized protein (DUF1800 family)
MGDEGSTLSEPEARHLLRRAGFDVPEKTVAKWMASGVTRGEAADQLLKFHPQGFKPNGKSFEAIHDKWLKFMLKTKRALQEKLVLFWHDHFATGISKVQDPVLMTKQNALLRRSCKGDFKALVKAINRDPATMEYLDTVRNSKDGLNENYGRELQELFTLGVKDVAGNDNYLQEDIVQIARAFTGWRYNDKNESYLNGNRHDFGGAPKTIYKQTGQFGASGVTYAGGGSGVGEGEAEIDSVIDVIFQHRDTQSHNTVARRIARRLIEFFGTADPSQGFVDDVVGSGGPDAFDSTWMVSGALRRLFTHDEFYLGAGAPGVTANKSVAWPIDYVVTTLRTLKVKPKGKELVIAAGSYNAIRDHLIGMGQTLFDPPSVFGWDWETNWISSATLLARYGFVRDLTSARDGGGTSFRPEKLVDLELTDANDIVDAVLEACGVKALYSNPEKTTLATYLTAGAGSIDLTDYDYRNRKLNGLFALVLESPAYQLI